MNLRNIPKDILDIILEYDGRIKYRNGKYVNVIHQNDERYDVIRPVMNKKMIIMENTNINGTDFYFEFGFDVDNRVGLCYDLGFNAQNTFEICYYDLRNGWKQIRTFI